MCKTTILRRLTAMLAIAIVSGVTVMSAAAQDDTVRSLRIENGQVFIDDRLIPEDELPSALETEGIQLHYTFSGDVRPVVDINGAFFVIESDGLRPTPDGRSAVTLSMGRRPADRPGSGFGFVVGDEDAVFSALAAPHAAGVGRQARELAAQAVRLQEMQARLEGQFEQHEMEELTEAAARLSRQAEEAARAAEALPSLGVQNYLAGVQRHDHELFELLVQEREIEAKTIRLSRQIRTLSDEREREHSIEELRSLLDEAFELKQANRRREIDQLDERLNELQERLEERERMRAEIIDNRLRELVHDRDDYDW